MLRVEERIRALNLAPHELVCIAIESPIRHMIVAAALFRLGHPIMSAAKANDMIPFRLPVSVFLQADPEPLIAGCRQIIVGDEWFVGDRRRLTPAVEWLREQSKHLPRRSFVRHDRPTEGALADRQGVPPISGELPLRHRTWNLGPPVELARHRPAAGDSRLPHMYCSRARHDPRARPAKFIANDLGLRRRGDGGVEPAVARNRARSRRKVRCRARACASSWVSGGLSRAR